MAKFALIIAPFLSPLLAVQALAGDAATVVAQSPSAPTMLGTAPVDVKLAGSKTSAPGGIQHCYVEVDGLSANRPVGTGYDISIALTSESKATAVGPISFYDAVGVPPAASPGLSYEVPARYCAATTGQAIRVTIAPHHQPAAGAKPLIGAVKLIAR